MIEKNTPSIDGPRNRLSTEEIRQFGTISKDIPGLDGARARKNEENDFLNFLSDICDEIYPILFKKPQKKNPRETREVKTKRSFTRST